MSKKQHTPIYDLKKYDVYFEDDPAYPKIFSLTGLPRYISYGKTGFYVGFNDPTGTGFYLKNNSDILIEVVGPNEEIIFSDLIDIKSDVSGNAAVYLRIDSKQLYKKYESISDGIGHIILVGELGGNIPNNWKGKYNCRLQYPIEIAKDFDNRSSIFFETNPTIEANTFSIDDSTIGRATLPSVIRTFTSLETDNIHTVGGIVSYVDVSYRSDASSKSQFVRYLSYIK